jgi:hypothetical protein
MNPISSLILLASLLQIALMDTIEAHLDIPASLNLANVALLTRIDRIMQINYRFMLDQTNTWTQHPDFKTTFDLPFSQYVKFHYNINMGSSVDCTLATRVKIDGV